MFQMKLFEFQISGISRRFFLQIACLQIALFQCTFPVHVLRFASYRNAKRTKFQFWRSISGGRSSQVEIKSERRACCDSPGADRFVLTARDGVPSLCRFWHPYMRLSVGLMRLNPPME